MAIITLRNVKGSALTFQEGDDNFTNLNNDKIESVVEDTTPSLGGDLNGQSFRVQDIQLENYKETVFPLTYAGTLAPNVANGNVQTVTLTGNVTINGFTAPEAGQSMTLIIKQDATGSRLLTSTMLWAGGDKTLSVDPIAVDIVSIFFDGVTYYASISKAFS